MHVFKAFREIIIVFSVFGSVTVNLMAVLKPFFNYVSLVYLKDYDYLGSGKVLQQQQGTVSEEIFY